MHLLRLELLIYTRTLLLLLSSIIYATVAYLTLRCVGRGANFFNLRTFTSRVIGGHSGRSPFPASLESLIVAEAASY